MIDIEMKDSFIGRKRKGNLREKLVDLWKEKEQFRLDIENRGSQKEKGRVVWQIKKEGQSGRYKREGSLVDKKGRVVWQIKKER